MKNVKMFVLLALSLCITLFATSCSKDDPSQVSFTSLNMLDENHGKTLLGETGVYINGSMNFRSDSWQVVDLGILQVSRVRRCQIWITCQTKQAYCQITGMHVVIPKMF